MGCPAVSRLPLLPLHLLLLLLLLLLLFRRFFLEREELAEAEGATLNPSSPRAQRRSTVRTESFCDAESGRRCLR